MAVPRRVMVVDESATVRRVAARTLERAGYEVWHTADTREALERAQREVPDLVLLDPVQRSPGVELSRALRAVANLRHVPVVVMSAREADLEDDALEASGAADALRKPFAPEALLAVAGHVLEGAAALGTEPGSQPAAGKWPAVCASVETDPSRERYEAAQAIAERLARDLGPITTTSPPAAAPGEDQAAGPLKLGSRWLEELGAEKLLELASTLGSLLPGDRGEVSLAGRLDHVSIGEVLQLLQHQKLTGILRVEREDRRLYVCLRDGTVDLALAQGVDAEFLLGRYLLQDGLIERQDLDFLLDRRHGARPLLGTQLVKLGYITADDLRRVLVRQTSELMYETLRWPRGRFQFERHGRRPEAEEARLGLPVASILMEGLRRVDEWRLIEEQIVSFDEVLAPDPVAGARTEARLSAEERRVLATVDGERTVRQIVGDLGMGSFETCKILFQLLTARLIRPAPESE